MIRNTILAAFLFMCSNLTYADCKTVMGGCVKEDVVNIAPHMRADNLKPANIAAKPAQTAKKASNSNATVATNQKVALNSKKI